MIRCLGLVILVALTSCGGEKQPQGPVSEKSKLPWNQTGPGGSVLGPMQEKPRR